MIGLIAVEAGIVLMTVIVYCASVRRDRKREQAEEV
jgi:preprotein translocase subunit YajC